MAETRIIPFLQYHRQANQDSNAFQHLDYIYQLVAVAYHSCEHILMFFLYKCEGASGKCGLRDVFEIVNRETVQLFTKRGNSKE